MKQYCDFCPGFEEKPASPLKYTTPSLCTVMDTTKRPVIFISASLVIILVAAILFLPYRHRITIMTYNVGAFSKYKECSIQDVADIIGSEGAVAVSLNELDSCNRRHSYYQLDSLSRVLGGWNHFFSQAFPYAGGAYGNGVVCKEPILKTYRIVLPIFDGSEQRSVAVVETGQYVFASTHLDYKGEAAPLRQAEVISEWFRKNYPSSKKPVFLAGDMNSLPGSETISFLKKDWELLSAEENSFDSTNPSECIDYVFRLRSSQKVRVLESHVVKPSEKVSGASDHLPVSVTVKWR